MAYLAQRYSIRGVNPSTGISPLPIGRAAPAGPPARGPGLEPASLLTEITAGLAQGSDLQLLLQHFLEPIVRLAGAQAGAVRVLGDDGESLELISEIGLPATVTGAERTVDRHCGACGEAADQARLVWADDLSPCTQRAHGEFFGEGCRRVLAVPLQYRGELLGIYNLFFVGSDAPTPEIAAVLKSVGELLGLALHNARLEADNLRATVLHERQSMAAEVHDSIAQTLTFVKMRLPLLQEAMLAHDDVHSLKFFGDVKQAVGEVHASVRQILTQFRTQMPAQGLIPALQAGAASFEDRTGVQLEMVNHASGLALSPPQETQVFHIVQEALANVAKHAMAKHARLTLARRADQVEVLVEDDGHGLAPVAADAPSSGVHFGLEIMKERARSLGGDLDIGTRASGGTCVRLLFPAAPPGTRANRAETLDAMRRHST